MVGRFLPLLSAFIISAAAFCNYFSCWTPSDWSRPWCVFADVPLFGGYFQAVAEGEAPLFGGSVSRLNAPFQAQWFDFPTTEVLVYGYGGLLTRWFGFFTAYNLCLASAHGLALLTFYWTARRLNGSRWAAALTACAWANSRFLYVRDTIHINLSFLWHLPLIWWVCVRSRASEGLSAMEKLAFLGVCLASGWQHPYYCFFALTMYFLTALGSAAVARWTAVRRLLGLSLVTLVFLGIAQLDTLTGWYWKGKSFLAFDRPLSQLIFYGLRLPELFLPAVHRLADWQNYTQSQYYSGLGSIAGESDSSYLGILGGGAFLWCLSTDLVRILRGRSGSFYAATLTGILLIALAGGLNLALGALGLTLFRCGCRFSVLVLAGSLLYLSQRLSQKRLPGWIAVALMMLSCLDTTPPAPAREQRVEVSQYLENHIAVVRFLESRLRPGSTVFQYPVQSYPEVGSDRGLPTYEQMLPFLLSKELRYSFGNCRGRPESQWQQNLPIEDPEALCKELETYGFGAAILYKKALGTADSSWVRWSRKPDFTSPARDLQVYLLKPECNAKAPAQLPCVSFDSSFHEGPGVLNLPSQICQGKGTIRLLVGNPGPYQLTFHLSLMGSKAGRVAALVDGKTVWMGEVPGGLDAYAQTSVDLSRLPAGNHRLSIVSEVPREIHVSSAKVTIRGGKP